MTTSNTTISFGKQLLFATIAGSSILVAPIYEMKSNEMPSLVASYSKMGNSYSWENPSGSQVNVEFNSMQYETIVAFAEKVIGNSQDIDFEIQDAINKIFWDLI